MSESSALRRSVRKRKAKGRGDDSEFSSTILDSIQEKRAKLAKLSDEERVYCQQILTGLMKHKFALPFNRPVDTSLFTDYPLIVSTPMDFSTIQSRLDSSFYTSCEEFAQDVRLVFKNCWAYNQAGSPICVQATSLSNYFEREFKKVSSIFSRAQEDKEIIEMQQTINQLRQEHSKLLQELQKLFKEHKKEISTSVQTPTTKQKQKQQKSQPTQKKKSKPEKKETPKKVSLLEQLSTEYGYKDKERLSRKINYLSSEHLEKMVDIISGELTNQNGGEVEIDLEILSNSTLSKLEKYVNTCLQQQENASVLEQVEDSSDSDSEVSSSDSESEEHSEDH